MKKTLEHIQGEEVVFDDYPTNKFAKKIDWWTSPQGLELIAGWRQCGCSISDIVDKMGIDPRTFRSWRKKCPELDEILIVGREITNARVIDALYKKAVGYSYDEVTQELVEGEMRVTKIVTKHVPPETKAILSWLYNRNPDLWRAIQQPIDVDAPMLMQAEDVLVSIREAAEGASEPLLGPQEVRTPESPSSNTEGQEKATEGLPK